jgi:hypothetical protein
MTRPSKKKSNRKPPLVSRKWRRELVQRFANIPRNVEQEKVEVDHLDAYFTDFKDMPFTTVLSAFGYHTTFDGSQFRPEAEVSLLHTEKDFYLKIQGFLDTFEFTDSDRAELWLLRRAETAYFMKAKLVENYFLSLVVMIRTAKYRNEVNKTWQTN